MFDQTPAWGKTQIRGPWHVILTAHTPEGTSQLTGVTRCGYQLRLRCWQYDAGQPRGRACAQCMRD